jgi:hypothetical protein
MQYPKGPPMNHSSSQFDDRPSIQPSPLGYLPGEIEALPDPYAACLTADLTPRWTDDELNRHVWEAVRYGVRMERERILSATKELTYVEDEDGEQMIPT